MQDLYKKLILPTTYTETHTYAISNKQRRT